VCFEHTCESLETVELTSVFQKSALQSFYIVVSCLGCIRQMSVCVCANYYID